MPEIKKEAYNKAIDVIEKCSTKYGFRAAYPGYNGIWARDSIITSLGASLLGDKFKDVFKNSLITLSKYQTPNGQIPNAILKYDNKPKIDLLSIDSTLWYLIGHYVFKERYNESSLMRKYSKNIRSSLIWLSYQDIREDYMLDQLPTTDWQDAFPHKYGHCISTQALYYKVLNLSGRRELAKKLNFNTNFYKELKLWDENYYLAYRWKNHNKYRELGRWFDSLGNLLSILFDLADETKARRILEYIKENRIDSPCPMKAIYPAIEKNSEYWQDYYLDCEAKTPYHYLNGGIWTYIGGFYVLALLKLNKFKEAEIQLNKLANANIESNFAEWLNGLSGKTGFSHSNSQEGNQAWNAGMYILAYESIRRKKVLI